MLRLICVLFIGGVFFAAADSSAEKKEERDTYLVISSYDEDTHSLLRNGVLYVSDGNQVIVACQVVKEADKEDEDEDHSDEENEPPSALDNLVWYRNNKRLCGARDGRLCEYDRLLPDHLTLKLRASDSAAGAYSCRSEKDSNVKAEEFEIVYYGQRSQITTDVSGNGPSTVLVATDPLIITCSPIDPNYSIKSCEWKHDGETVEPEDKRIHVHDNGTLHIVRANLLQSGIYHCKCTIVSLDKIEKKVSGFATVFSKPYVDHHRMSEGLNVIEGYEAAIECPAYGYPTPKIEWSRDGKEFEGTKNVHFSRAFDDGVENSRVDFSETTTDDYGTYSCMAINEHGNDTGTQILRVKSKLAPLWPFIGIVIELIILAVIIFVHEKRQPKSDPNELHLEVADAHMNRPLSHHGDNVRQRKPA